MAEVDPYHDAFVLWNQFGTHRPRSTVSLATIPLNQTQSMVNFVFRKLWTASEMANI